MGKTDIELPDLRSGTQLSSAHEVTAGFHEKKDGISRKVALAYAQTRPNDVCMRNRPKPQGGGAGIVRSQSIAMCIALEIVHELRVKEQQVIKKHACSERPSSPPGSSRAK
jgi:hypothetical protein